MRRKPEFSYVPAAFFLTLSAYGHRLHGEDGSVDHSANEYGQPGLEPDSDRVESELTSMKWPRMTFDSAMRTCIELAFSEVCQFRGWVLLACHCRTNHAHLVVHADATTSKLLHDLKSVATRRLRQSNLLEVGQPAWAEHGSTKYLWQEEDVMATVNYTVNRQGSSLPGSLLPGPTFNTDVNDSEQ